MTRTSTIWHIIKQHVPKRQWISSDEIYGIVELHTKLDGEDLTMQSPKSHVPRWKLLVRNVLVDRLHKGKLRWVKDRNIRAM